MLRIFNHLYLNDALVQEALSAVEGGIVGDAEETVRDGSGGGVAGGLSAGPAQLSGHLDSSGESELKRTRKDTPEARFSRLVSVLNDADSLLYFDSATNPDDWYSAGRGLLFEAQGRFHLGLLRTIDEPLQNLQGMLALLTAVGMRDQVDVPEEKFRQISAAAQMTAGRPIPFAFYLSENEKCLAVGQLEPDYLRVTPTKLSGEFTLFGKVTGLMNKGETFDMTGMMDALLDLMNAENRQQRRAKGRKLAKSPGISADGQNFLGGPALKILPYAVVI